MHVLVVSHAFPPLGEVGSLRVARFCRYLPSFGIQPVVLTAQEKYYSTHDPSMPLPEGVRVERTPMLATPVELYSRWKTRRAEPPDGHRRQRTSEAPAEPARGFFKRQILNLLQIPDANWGWYWPAIRAGNNMLRRESFAAIFSSAPPWTSHLVALRLKKIFGIPWIADFRDAWAADPWRATAGLPRWRDKVEAKLEASCLRWADLVVCVTEGVRENLLQHHAGLVADKFVVLTNGFDGLIQPSPPRTEHGRRRLLLHLGSLYAGRRVDTFCEALVSLVRSGNLDPSSFKVLFLGDNDDAIIASARKAAPDLIRSNCIEFRPRVGWQEAQKSLEHADLLLVFQGDHQIGATAKFYEYLPTGKPIFAVSPKGALSDLLETTGSGIWADPGDADAVASGLLQALGRPPRSAEEVQRVARQFHFESLTRRLAEWITVLAVRHCALLAKP